jgi:hypothetical protein
MVVGAIAQVEERQVCLLRRLEGDFESSGCLGIISSAPLSLLADRGNARTFKIPPELRILVLFRCLLQDNEQSVAARA